MPTKNKNSNTGLVSLIELRDEVKAFDATSILDIRKRVEAYLNQFGDGKKCEICEKEATQKKAVYGEDRVFQHDDFMDHHFVNNQIPLPLNFTGFFNNDVMVQVHNNQIKFKHVNLKQKSLTNIVNTGRAPVESDIKTYNGYPSERNFNLDDLNDLREMMIYLPHFVEMYKDYLVQNKIEIETIAKKLKF